MTWGLYFKVIGIVYPIYYGINIAYDLIVYYKKKSQQERGVQEYDLSHLNNQNDSVRPPQKVSEILAQEKHQNSITEKHLKIESNESLDSQETQTLDVFFTNGFDEFSNYAKEIYKNEAQD